MTTWSTLIDLNSFQEFNLRSSVMIESAPSAVMKEIIQDNLAELDAGIKKE